MWQRWRRVLAGLGVGLALCWAMGAGAYVQLTDTNGGNARLGARHYDVFVENDPKNPGSRAEVVAALQKWQAELAKYQVTLTLRDGNPPQTAIDRTAYAQQAQAYAKDPDAAPDMTKYPEVQKSMQKENTLSIYFRTSDAIQTMGNGTERGRLNWLLSGDTAGQIESGDIFLPNDRLGGTDEVARTLIHNIALHEIGHFAGLDHYSAAQRQGGGQVMQVDASLFDQRLNLGAEETGGLKSVYGPQPAVQLHGSAQQQSLSELPPEVLASLPPGVDRVWRYLYDIERGATGEALSYFQVEVNSAPVYYAAGLGALADWTWQVWHDDEKSVDNGTSRLYGAQGLRENIDRLAAIGDLLEFDADATYLTDAITPGRLVFYTDRGPDLGLLVSAGGQQFGLAPSAIDEPATLMLGLVALLAGAWAMRPARRVPPRLAAAAALAVSLLGWPLGVLADPATIRLGDAASENGTISYEFQDAKGNVQFRLHKDVQKGETAQTVIDYFENAMKLFGAAYKVTRSSETLPGGTIMYALKIEPQGTTPNIGKVEAKVPSGYGGGDSVDHRAPAKAAIEVTPQATSGAGGIQMSGNWQFDLLDQDLYSLASVNAVAGDAADPFDVLRPFYEELTVLGFQPLLASAGAGGANLSLLSSDNLFFRVAHDDTRFALTLSDQLLVPEPATLGLAALGLMAALLAGAAAQRRRAAVPWPGPRP